MSIIFPLIYFLMANAFFVLLLEKSFGKCFPLTLFISALSYFFSQVLFSTFKIGFIINLIIPIVFIVLIILNRKNKRVKDVFKSNYFSSGFYAFLTIFILITIFDYNRSYTVWDEFSHWGVMIKELLRLDKFYGSDLSTLMVHKDYPPIIQLFETFYVKISGGYLESTVYKGFRLFEFGLLLPFLDYIKDKKKYIIFKTFLVVVIMYLLLLLFDGHGIINAIYLDYIMAIMVAYIIGIIIIEKNQLSNFYLVTLCLAMSCLVLTKQMAFPLYLMTVFIFVIKYLITNKGKVSLKSIKAIILVVIIPIIIWKGWNNYVSTLDVDKQFLLSDLKITKIKCIATRTCGEEWQQTSFINYYKTLKTKEITTSKIISLSYPQCIFLTILLIYLLWLYGKKILKKSDIYLLLSTLLIGYVGYAVVMLIMYVFSFGPIEGPNLASFDRYMPTYVIISLTVILMLFAYVNSIKEDKNNLLIIISLLLILIESPMQFEKMFPKIVYKKSGYLEYMKFDKYADNIRNYLEPNSKLFVVAQNSIGEYQFYIKYYLDNVFVNKDLYSFSINNESNIEYYNNEILPILKKYDYIYLVIIDDSFVKNFDFMFDNNIKKEGLYKINYKNDKLYLELVN